MFAWGALWSEEAANFYSVRSSSGGPGGSLQNSVKEGFHAAGKLDFSWFLHWTVQLSDALVHFKENDIVHHGIKPSNIVVVEADSTLMVADFGLAPFPCLRSGGTF